MADFRHHFLGGYRYCSSTKPRLRIDLGTKKGLPFRACRNSIWFDFYDCSRVSASLENLEYLENPWNFMTPMENLENP